MQRRAEKRMLFCGALWNIITATLTIVGYSSWFKNEGVKTLQTHQELSYGTSSLLDNVTSVIMLFGLFMLAMGIVNLFMVKQIKQFHINKQLMIWLGFCTVVQFLSFDILGTIFYLVTIVLYGSRNKAIRLATE